MTISTGKVKLNRTLLASALLAALNQAGAREAAANPQAGANATPSVVVVVLGSRSSA